jgi:drug/metabolite transporter (DMT)-like permease
MALPGGRRPEPIFFALLALVWGSSYVAIGLVGDEIGPFSLVAGRLVVGTLALAVVALLLRNPLPSRRQLPRLAVAGALGIVIPFSLIAWSERSVDAGLASILVAAAPLVSAVIVARTTRDDHLGPIRTAGLGIGFLGVLAVAGGGIDRGGDPIALGALLGAAVSYAANGAWTRRHLSDVPPLTAALGQAAGALVLILLVVAVAEHPTLAVPSGHTLLAMLWLGLLSSGVAPLLYFRLVATWGATRTTMVNYLTPVVGVVAGAFVLGERLSPVSLAGGALVVTGVALANFGFRRSVRGPLGLRALGQGARSDAPPVQSAPIARSPAGAVI